MNCQMLYGFLIGVASGAVIMLATCIWAVAYARETLKTRKTR